MPSDSRSHRSQIIINTVGGVLALLIGTAILYFVPNAWIFLKDLFVRLYKLLTSNVSLPIWFLGLIILFAMSTIIIAIHRLWVSVLGDTKKLQTESNKLTDDEKSILGCIVDAENDEDWQMAGGPVIDYEHVAFNTKLAPVRLSHGLKSLQQKGFIRKDNYDYALTQEGRDFVIRMGMV